MIMYQYLSLGHQLIASTHLVTSHLVTNVKLFLFYRYASYGYTKLDYQTDSDYVKEVFATIRRRNG